MVVPEPFDSGHSDNRSRLDMRGGQTHGIYPVSPRQGARVPGCHRPNSDVTMKE